MPLHLHSIDSRWTYPEKYIVCLPTFYCSDEFTNFQPIEWYIGRSKENNSVALLFFVIHKIQEQLFKTPGSKPTEANKEAMFTFFVPCIVFIGVRGSVRLAWTAQTTAEGNQ